MSTVIFSQVQAIIVNNLGVEPEKVNMDTSFNALGMDSLDALALINELEIMYNIRLPNEEVLKIRTVANAVETLQEYVPAS